MTCDSCNASYTATNQHTECPQCGKKVGTDKARDLLEVHGRVVKWFEDWETSTRDARKDAERDRDYYDGMQWTQSEVDTLNKRGQPVIVKNRIFKKVNFLLGTEVRNRADPKALPRTPSHDDDVNAVTDALRYVCDEQDFDRVSSVEWEYELIEGYGGAVVEHEIEGEGDDAEVCIRIRDVAWDRLWYDIHSRKPDFSDAIHKGISTWWDLDDAVAHYAERTDTSANFEEILEQALTHANTGTDTHEDKPLWAQVGEGRKRILVSECYYKEKGEWLVCHYTRAGFVVPPKPTGYTDEKGKNVCPLIMASAFVTRDGMRYGLVRHMIGSQDEINKRSSKALHWLSVDRVIAEDGAVLNPDEARTERAKPDGWVQVQRNALSENRIIFEKGIDMAQGQMQLLAEAKQDIDAIGPEMPQAGGADLSGRALMMRQQMGSLELERCDDNHKRWKKTIYRHIWLRIRQFWPEEKWVRVTDDSEKTGFRFVGLNRRMKRADRFMELIQKEVPLQSAITAVMGPEGRQLLEKAMQMVGQMQQAQGGPPMPGQPPPQPPDPEQQQQAVIQVLAQAPQMQEPMTAGDVASLDVDIVLDESPDVSILQQEEYEQLTQLIPAFLQAKPEMAGQLLTMALRASQLRAKKELLKMLEQPQDPKQAQMQEMMQQLQAAKGKADVDVAQSQAQLNAARAQQAGADAQTKVPLAEAEIHAKQAGAIHDAAIAGAKVGGGGAF